MRWSKKSTTISVKSNKDGRTGVAADRVAAPAPLQGIMTTLNLSPRLEAVASFVRENARLCDVGTDHAYLPVWLILNGRAGSAVASDVLEGPLRRAAETVAAYGLEDSIRLNLGNGLDGLETEGVTDIVIAGMGGELISDILSAAEWVRFPDIRLILQPMTKQDELRRFLCENGFAITEEALAGEGRRIYQVICASYDGILRELSPLELLVGPRNMERGGRLFRRLLCELRERYEIRRAGRKSAGCDTAGEDAVLEEIAGVLSSGSRTETDGH